MAMIQVESLCRRFGPTMAIRDISFSVERGEIVGFLGPNGAGKTTTMRILTGSLGATAGQVSVGGIDVATNPLGVKRLVGYLPEAPPVYGDMTVRGYLRFCARLKKAKSPKESVEKMIERVGLSPVAHRVIGHLSKGYRQRVGIAQALVHDPQVLILDEPASGLDPAQRVEIRGLVKDLSEGDVTVVLSTHVLPEVEAICDRVIIIDRGRIVAHDAVEGLSAPGRDVTLVVARPDPALVATLTALEGVLEVTPGDEGVIQVRADRDVREEVASVAVPHGLLELQGRQGLEQQFLRLTGEG